jgi:hypothetical protein
MISGKSKFLVGVFPAMAYPRIASSSLFVIGCFLGVVQPSQADKPAIAAKAGSASMSAVMPGTNTAFMKYWKSGLAEIATYDVDTERYGEMRKAQGVLIFVYEETHSDTRIKIESDKSPPEKWVPTLKLNNVLKFNTGIYDYSVMTSVFTGLSGKVVKRPFQPLKISFTSQEWCGQVYQHVLPMSSGIVSQIHSYFEAEGDSQMVLPYPKGDLYYEDEMPVLLRELNGPFLQIGEARKIDLMPSLWERRKRHQPLATAAATLEKVGIDTLNHDSRRVATVHWVLETAGVKTHFRIETMHPRRLLAWENSRGEKGRLIRSVRKSYWSLNDSKNEPLRKELGLKFGVEDKTK